MAGEFVIATIETNSSNVLALPVATASGSGNLSPRTLGGFATTLAAAKASRQAQDSANSVEETESASSPEAGNSATPLSGKITAAGNGQTKKSQSASPTAQFPLISNVATPVVPSAIPVAKACSSLVLQPSLTRAAPPVLSAALPVEAAVVPQENSLTGWRTVTLQGDPLADGSNSLLNLGGKISGTPSSFGGSQKSIASSFAPSISVPTANAPNSLTAVISTVAKTVPLSLSNAELLPSSAVLPAVSGKVVTKSTAESSRSVAANGAGASSLRGNAESVGSLPQGLVSSAGDNVVENANGAALGSGSGTLPAEAVQPAGEANGPANVTSDSGAGAEVLIASAEISSVPVRDAAPSGEVPANPASGMSAYGSSVSGTNDTAIALAAAANPAPQFSPGRTTLPLSFNVPNISKVVSAIATPNVGAVAGNSVATTPAAASALPGDASPQSMLASQTPFSIFFSSSSASAGPGTESAASTLPKMILPGAEAAIREGHANGNGPDLNANPQTGSAQTSAIQTSSHGPAPQIVKDALTGSDKGTVPAGQSLHSSADANAANMPLAAASVIATIPAAANSPAAISPLVATASVVSESQTKANTLPAASSATPNNAVPTLPETPVVGVPGPVQMAQMVNRAEQSEMRIGMTTSAFGSVEVRTVVHANDVGLVIGSEKGDLRTLLSNDMPAIASILQEKNLTLHSVNFMQGFAFSNNASGGGGSEQQSFVPTRIPSAGEGSEAAAEDSQETLPRPEWSGASGSLSILA